MKKILLIFFISSILVPLSLSAGDFDDKGVISGWRFAPLQIDIGLVKPRKLVDESTNTIFSFGLFMVQQRSAIISSAVIANTLQNNYGIQLPPLFVGTGTYNNYGISLGFENYCKNCYGIQMGILNHSWAGETVEEHRERWQFFGINIADTVYIGIANFTNKIQLGLFNFSKGAYFQFGLLNYNSEAYFPLLPLFNFSAGEKKEK